MRRVTVQEAASFLGVDEEVVKAQITSGQLVACQDAEYRGYVWLNEAVEAPPARKSRRKSQRAKDRPSADSPHQEAQSSASVEISQPASTQEPVSQPEQPERRSRTSQRAQEVQLLQDVVAMLREQLSTIKKQLELKDVEIEARREEVKGLLAMLYQSRALPAAPGQSQTISNSIALNLRSACAIAMERVSSGLRRLWLYLSRLATRWKTHSAPSSGMWRTAREANGSLGQHLSPDTDDAVQSLPEVTQDPGAVTRHK